MIKFKQKEYGGAKGGGNVAALALSGAGLGVSMLNLHTNRKNREEGREDRREQTKAIKRLNETLTQVDKKLIEHPEARVPYSIQQQQSQPTTFRQKLSYLFKQKNNSYTTKHALQGAVLGGAIGGGLLRNLSFDGRQGTLPGTDSPYSWRNVTYWDDKGKLKTKKVTKLDQSQVASNRAITMGASVLIGAALGAIYGLIKDSSNSYNRHQVDERLSDRIIRNLNNLGFKEGTQFTRDPKTADLLKTKVCVIISRTNGDLKIVINYVNDSKFKEEAQKIIKNLPPSAVALEKMGDRFNDITITTVSDKTQDPALVSGILEQFIRRGYPVYIVEVG